MKFSYFFIHFFVARLIVNRMHKQPADTVIVLDFETTGLSPDNGDRAIEIGAVLIENGAVTGSFQQLMNPGQRISSSTAAALLAVGAAVELVVRLVAVALILFSCGTDSLVRSPCRLIAL